MFKTATPLEIVTAPRPGLLSVGDRVTLRDCQRALAREPRAVILDPQPLAKPKHPPVGIEPGMMAFRLRES